MIEAIAEARIDIVVNWSLAYETFSFTAHEALAGAAFVVAREGAGHVWPAILAAAPDRGVALNDENSLFDLFAGPGLPPRVHNSRRRYGALIPTGGSADVLLCSKPLTANAA
jgi:hypothetical protein